MAGAVRRPMAPCLPASFANVAIHRDRCIVAPNSGHRFRFHGRSGMRIVFVSLLVLFASVASAADRCVLLEEFTWDG